MKDDKYLEQLNGILIGVGVTELWSVDKFEADPNKPIVCWCNTASDEVAQYIMRELPEGSVCMPCAGADMEGYRCIYKDGIFRR